MNSKAEALKQHAHANPDRPRMLAQREAVMRTYGDPIEMSRKARAQALKLRARLTS